MSKQAYIKISGDYHNYYLKPVKLTGRIKTVTGGPWGDGQYLEYYRKWWWNGWAHVQNIIWLDEQKVTVEEIDIDMYLAEKLLRGELKPSREGLKIRKIQKLKPPPKNP